MTEPSPSAPPELVTALNQVLDGEYAAVWAYGRIGAEVSGERQSDARDALRAHRSNRERIRAQLAGLGVTPTPPPAAYESPSLANQADAESWAQRIELALVPRYSALAAVQQGDLRAGAAADAQACATRAIRWGAVSQALPGIDSPSDAAGQSGSSGSPPATQSPSAQASN